MFATLIESKPRRQRRTGGALLSVAVHLGLIAGAIAATSTIDARPAPPPKPVIIPISLRPHDPGPEQPKPVTPTPPRGPVEGPLGPPIPPLVFRNTIDHTIPPVDATSYAGSLDSLLGAGGNVDLTQGSIGAGRPRGDGDVYRGDQVDKGIAAIATPTPPYPEMLRAAGVEGRVVVRFVVDTTGRIEPASLEIRESTHDLFTRAVRDALPRFRFAPAEANGRRVRVLVEMPFEFSLRR